jgi:integrase
MITPLTVSLPELLDQFILNHEKGLSPSTIACFYKPAISDFSKFLGRDPEVFDLTKENINRWIMYKTEMGCPAPTIKTRRNAILALWRWAYQEEILDEEPKRIRRVRLSDTGVDAWTPEEITLLVQTALDGNDYYLGTTKLPRSLYFASMVLTGYDTALRLGDIFALKKSMINVKNRCGYMRVVESKTGKQKHAQIYPHTMKLIDRLWDLNPDREFIWPLWCRREQFYRSFRTLVKQAKVRPGTFRWLRRASITQVELVKPGWGTIHAGHSDQKVTQRHYTDRSQLVADVIAPPPLFNN